jgi:hypothetical protein
MDWTAHIDLYCERLGPGLWEEPLNFLSNGAFLVASGFLLVRLMREPPRDWPAIGFAILIGIIGIGSGLFHLFANRWSLIADVAPITAFIYGYFFLAMGRFLGLGWFAALAATAAFFAISPFVQEAARPLIGGSAGYLPGLLAIGIVAALAWPRAPQPAQLLALAGLTFAVSLTFRTLDQPLCAQIAIGTHFLWHILNAVTLAILVLAATKARPKSLLPQRPN